MTIAGSVEFTELFELKYQPKSIHSTSDFCKPVSRHSNVFIKSFYTCDSLK